MSGGVRDIHVLRRQAAATATFRQRVGDACGAARGFASRCDGGMGALFFTYYSNSCGNRLYRMLYLNRWRAALVNKVADYRNTSYALKNGII